MEIVLKRLDIFLMEMYGTVLENCWMFMGFVVEDVGDFVDFVNVAWS